MKYIRERDLNDEHLNPKIAALWKARYFGLRFSTMWVKFSFIGDKLKEEFSLSNQELDVLESILWSERITISGLSIYLSKEMSNISRTVSNLKKKNILMKMPDKTLNITEEFYDKWYTFLRSEDFILLLNESIDVLKPKIKITILRMEESLECLEKIENQSKQKNEKIENQQKYKHTLNYLRI